MVVANKMVRLYFGKGLEADCSLLGVLKSYDSFSSRTGFSHHILSFSLHSRLKDTITVFLTMFKVILCLHFYLPTATATH